MGDIVLTEKQMNYIRAKVYFDKVFLEYRKLLGEHAAVWQNDAERFAKFEAKIREITGLEQARQGLRQSREELNETDNLELLNDILDFTKDRKIPDFDKPQEKWGYSLKNGSKFVYYNKDVKKEKG